MRFRTDKLYHGYLPTYLRIASEIGERGRVAELGVLDGDSLEMWQALFPAGVIVGVDCNPDAVWPSECRRVVSAQDDPRLPLLLKAIAPAYDLIVDDASHEGPATAKALELLWPLVRPGGWYVIEDWMVGFSTYDEGSHGPGMLEMARELLWRVSDQQMDCQDITYRYGQILLRKKR